MDLKALYKPSYGVYVVTSKKGNRINGQIANTLFQVTPETPTAAVQVLIDVKGGYIVGEVNREMVYTPLKGTRGKRKALHVGLTDLLEILSD